MSNETLRIVAERDGLTIDQARVLIERWSWPIGMAIKPAYEQALENHPHWQQWRDGNRDSIMSLAEWQSFVASKTGARP